MDFQNICKKTGYFCVGASVWMAEMTVNGAIATGKGIARAAKTMTQKGEMIMVQKKAAAEERRKAAEQVPQETVANQPITACT